MSMVKEQHECLDIPSGFVIVKSPSNGWVVATTFDGCAETKVWGIKHCPYCGEKLN